MSCALCVSIISRGRACNVTLLLKRSHQHPHVMGSKIRIHFWNGNDTHDLLKWKCMVYPGPVVTVAKRDHMRHVNISISKVKCIVQFPISMQIIVMWTPTRWPCVMRYYCLLNVHLCEAAVCLNWRGKQRMMVGEGDSLISCFMFFFGNDTGNNWELSFLIYMQQWP